MWDGPWLKVMLWWVGFLGGGISIIGFMVFGSKFWAVGWLPLFGFGQYAIYAFVGKKMDAIC